MAVNNTFCETYNYKPEQILNKFVDKFTDFVWFKKSLTNPYAPIPLHFPGEHYNYGKSCLGKPIPFIGASWAITDTNNKFLGLWAVHQKCNDEFDPSKIGINVSKQLANK